MNKKFQPSVKLHVLMCLSIFLTDFKRSTEIIRSTETDKMNYKCAQNADIGLSEFTWRWPEDSIHTFSLILSTKLN